MQAMLNIIGSICSIVGSIISNPFATIPYGQMLLIELVFKISQSILYILQVIYLACILKATQAKGFGIPIAMSV